MVNQRILVDDERGLKEALNSDAAMRNIGSSFQKDRKSKEL